MLTFKEGKWKTGLSSQIVLTSKSDTGFDFLKEEWKNVYTVSKKGYNFMEIRTYQTDLILYFTGLCVSLVKSAVDTLRFLLHI